MHVVNQLISVENDNQILRDKAHGFLLHRLRYPHTCVLCHADFAANDAYIGSIQRASLVNSVWISVGLDARKMACNDLSFGICAADKRIQVVRFLGFYHVASHGLRHFNKLFDSVGIGNTVDIHVGHIVLLTRIGTQSIEKFFLFHTCKLHGFTSPYPLSTADGMTFWQIRASHDQYPKG